MPCDGHVDRTAVTVKKKRILLGGFYGCGNLGDDAMLEVLIRTLSDVAPHVGVSYLTGGDEALDRSLSGRGATAVLRQPSAVLRAVHECDVLAFGGGSLLQNATGSLSLYAYLSLLSLARRFGKKTVILAGGLGPIDGKIPLRATASALRHLDYASFRDEGACALARALGASASTVSGDLALLLPMEVCAIPLPERFLLVALREKSGMPVHFVAQRILCLAEEKGLTPVLCSLFPREDGAYATAVAREISSLCGASGRENAVWTLPNLLPSCLRSIVSRASFVLTGRYHLALFAYAAGIPFSVLGDDPKLCAIKKEKRPPDEVTALVLKDIDRFIEVVL